MGVEVRREEVRWVGFWGGRSRCLVSALLWSGITRGICLGYVRLLCRWADVKGVGRRMIFWVSRSIYAYGVDFIPPCCKVGLSEIFKQTSRGFLVEDRRRAELESCNLHRISNLPYSRMFRKATWHWPCGFGSREDIANEDIEPVSNGIGWKWHTYPRTGDLYGNYPRDSIKRRCIVSRPDSNCS